MKIIINSSTFKGTGVTQVAVSFIHECIHFPEHEYLVFMSPNVAANVKQDEFPKNFRFYIFGKESLYGLKGKSDLKIMKRIESEYKPDAVFSVFGPSLWKPKAPHIQGYAYPYYVYTDSPLFNQLGLKERFMVALRRSVHMGHMKREGQYFVCETEDVSKRLHEKFNIDKNRIFTVSNTANSFFLNYKPSGKEIGKDGVFKLYSLCSNSPHKNLSILNSVIPVLRSLRPDKKVLFYLTIPQGDYDRMFDDEVKDSIINVGPLKVAECPAFVDSCDALFLPTLLECFSASYPEAMLLRKPILTSNLPFATTVCEDAAIYFEPLDSIDIANKIARLVDSPKMIKDLQEKGDQRLKSFLSPRERAKKYLEICKSVRNG